MGTRGAWMRYLPISVLTEFSPDRKETMRLIPVEKLRKAGVDPDAYASFYSRKAINWRETLFKKFEKILRRVGCDKKSLDLALHHVRERDYPVSAVEMRRIFSRVGFKTSVCDYRASSHPLKDYFRMVLASN